MLFVMFSISPVPNVRPAPVSYFHTEVSTPVFAAPVKSSDQYSVNPDGGAGMPAGAMALAMLAGVGFSRPGCDGFAIRSALEHAASVAAASTITPLPMLLIDILHAQMWSATAVDYRARDEESRTAFRSPPREMAGLPRIVNAPSVTRIP
ncbi:MAG TPA: hypothetical protein VJU87_00135 [Gemmatimonadaceae bacterium]|nr:hypothetical protein [Gemmatimonadaceae bacterium]